MSKLLRTLLLLPLLAAGASSTLADPVKPPPLQAVEKFDIGRYMGRWYEVARYPNRFQRDCVGEVTAEYLLLASGQVRVENRCRLADGRVDLATGLARLQGSRVNARLSVQFLPRWLDWVPFTTGDYWVIDIDPDYQLAAVSEPGREYLWVLARQPKVDPAAYEALLKRLAAMGFDPARLVRSAGAS